MSKYNGILNKGNFVFPYEMYALPYGVKAFETWAAQREDALFQHYGIERESNSAWRDLAFSLAEDHVPAYGKSQGRPSKNIYQDMIWYDFFLIIKERTKCTNKEAYERISERNDVEKSVVEVKDRLVKLRKNRPDVCKARDQDFENCLKSEWAEGFIKQKWGQVVDEGVLAAEMVSYHQHFSRFPYGPYQERFPIEHEYEMKRGEIPPLPEKT